MTLAWGGAPLLPSSSSEGRKHGSGLEALPALAINTLLFSPQLSTCCTGATSSRQGSCLAASCCCSSPWPNSASSVLWPTWPSPASRPPLASESTNQSYRPCRRLMRAIPSSECFAVMAGDQVSCGRSIPSGKSHFFSCCSIKFLLITGVSIVQSLKSHTGSDSGEGGGTIKICESNCPLRHGHFFPETLEIVTFISRCRKVVSLKIMMTQYFCK